MMVCPAVPLTLLADSSRAEPGLNCQSGHSPRIQNSLVDHRKPYPLPLQIHIPIVYKNASGAHDGFESAARLK